MSDDERGESDAPAFEAVVDRRLIEACERHERNGRRMVRDFAVRTWAREPTLHVDPAAWNTGYLKVRERDDLPDQLFADLRERMPQALLRDLHRLVMEERWVQREVIEGSAVDRGGFSALAEARAARTRPPLPRLESSTGAVRAYQRWRRDLVRERWQAAMSDDEPRNPSRG